MYHRVIHIASMAIILLTSAENVYASPSLGGIDGGLDFPSSEVQSDGAMTVGISYVGSGASYVFSRYPNRYYFLSTSIVPGVEVTARFSEVIGIHDPSIYLPNYIDRMISAKWTLDLPQGWPSLAIGALDLFSINEVNNLPGIVPGSSRYGISAYAVAGHRFGPVRWEAGYGEGKSYIRGPFSLLRVALGCGVDGIMEYGNGRFNVGLGYVAGSGFGLKVAFLQGKELGIASTYSFRL